MASLAENLSSFGERALGALVGVQEAQAAPLHSRQFLERVAKHLGPRKVPYSEQLQRLEGKFPRDLVSLHWGGVTDPGMALSGPSFAELARAPQWYVGYGEGTRDPDMAAELVWDSIYEGGYGGGELRDQVLAVLEGAGVRLTAEEKQGLKSGAIGLSEILEVPGREAAVEQSEWFQRFAEELDDDATGDYPFYDTYQRIANHVPGEYFESVLYNPLAVVGYPESLKQAAVSHFGGPDIPLAHVRGVGGPGELTFEEVQSDAGKWLADIGKWLPKQDPHDLSISPLRGLLSDIHGAAVMGKILEHLDTSPVGGGLTVRLPSSGLIESVRDPKYRQLYRDIYDRELGRTVVDQLSKLPGVKKDLKWATDPSEPARQFDMGLLGSSTPYHYWTELELPPNVIDQLRHEGWPRYRAAFGVPLLMDDEENSFAGGSR